MKHLLVISIIAGTISYNGHCQTSLSDFDKLEKTNFGHLRKQLKKIPAAQQLSVNQLARYIGSISTSNLEKAYAAYYWVSRNITYDMRSLVAHRDIPYRAHDVLQTKLAVCSGYANLYNEICEELGLKSKIVDGYSKGYGYEEGDNFIMTNHSWNLLLLNNKWYPVDVTWASPNSNSKEASGYRPGPTDYFMQDPKKFILNHLPEDPRLQLISPIISMNDFEGGADKVIELTRYALVVNKNEDSYLKYEDVAAHEVALKERALAFNPKNKNAVYRLGVAKLYQALDTMETMHDLTYESVLRELPKYKYRIYELLDEAAHHFKGVPSSSPAKLYESAQTFLSETTYQRGVFNYEAAQIIYDKTSNITRKDILPAKERINTAMNQYYDIALGYFDEIGKDSWYSDNAMRYIKAINEERSNMMIK